MVASIALLHQTLASADPAAPLTSRQTHRPRQRRRAGLLGAAARPPCRRRPLQPLLWRPGPLLPLHPCRLQPRAAGRRVAPPLWSGLAAFWELVGPGNKGGGTMCAPVLRSGQAGRLTRIAKGTLLCQAVQTARSGCCFGLCPVDVPYASPRAVALPGALGARRGPARPRLLTAPFERSAIH